MNKPKIEEVGGSTERNEILDNLKRVTRVFTVGPLSFMALGEAENGEQEIIKLPCQSHMILEYLGLTDLLEPSRDAKGLIKSLGELARSKFGRVLTGGLGLAALAGFASGCDADSDDNPYSYTKNDNFATNQAALIDASKLPTLDPLDVKEACWAQDGDEKPHVFKMTHPTDGEKIVMTFNRSAVNGGNIMYVDCNSILECLEFTGCDSSSPKNVIGVDNGAADLAYDKISGEVHFRDLGLPVKSGDMSYDSNGNLKVANIVMGLTNPIGGGYYQIYDDNGVSKLLYMGNASTAMERDLSTGPDGDGNDIIVGEDTNCGIMSKDPNSDLWIQGRYWLNGGVDSCRLVYANDRSDLPTTLQTVFDDYSEVNTDPIFASDVNNDYLLWTAGPSGVPQQRIVYIKIPHDAVCDDGNFEPTKGEECETTDPNCDTITCTCGAATTPDGAGACTPDCGNNTFESSTEACDTGIDSTCAPDCQTCIDGTPDGLGACTPNETCNDGFYDPSVDGECDGGPNCTDCSCDTGTSPDNTGGCDFDSPDVLDSSDVSDTTDTVDDIADTSEVNEISETIDTDPDQTVIEDCAAITANVLHTVTPGCKPATCRSDSADSLTIEVPAIDLGQCEYTIHNVEGKPGDATLTLTAMTEVPLNAKIKLVGAVNADGVFETIQAPQTVTGYGTEAYIDESNHGITANFEMSPGTAILVASASKMGVYVVEADNGDIIWNATNQTPIEEGIVETLLTTSTGMQVVFNMPITARDEYFKINLSEEFKNLTGERPDNSAEFLTDTGAPDAGVDAGFPVEGGIKDPGNGDTCCTVVRVPAGKGGELPMGTLFMLGGLAIVGINVRRKDGEQDRQQRKISPFVAMKNKFQRFLKGIA